MQVVPRCRSLLILRNPLEFSFTQFNSFHSTPICNDKWKKKWNSYQDFKRGQQPSKNYARYAIRQKRADTKRALRSLLFNCGDVGTVFQNAEQSRKAHGTSSTSAGIGGNSNRSTKKGRAKSSDSQRTEKIHNHKMRRKYRKGFLSEDDDEHPETIFHATFGNRWYTWSFNSWNGTSQRSTPGFDWRDTFHHTTRSQGKWKKTSRETDSEDDAWDVGSCSDRAILGLPTKGPLKMEDVKNAFRLSALKWHPDKHQGPSQAEAEEKFKLCVNAYKTLCSALSTA